MTAQLPPGHGPEAAALLQALDEELAQASDALGLPPGGGLEWSASEKLILEQIADALDRKRDLCASYRASDDDGARVKLSGEIRLLEGAVERMLRRIRTEPPSAPSLVSMKAQRAANTRWARDAAN